MGRLRPECATFSGRSEIDRLSHRPMKARCNRLPTLLMTTLALLCATVQVSAFVTMQQIRQRGELVVAYRTASDAWRIDDHRRARALADQFGVSLRVEEFSDTRSALKALEAGSIDLMSDPLWIQRPLPDSLTFSSPVRHDDLIVVDHAAHGARIDTPDTLAVQPGSDGWHYLMSLRQQGRRHVIESLPAHLSETAILSSIAAGQGKPGLLYRSQVDRAAVFGVSTTREVARNIPLSWVMRRSDTVLRDQVEEFLHHQAMSEQPVQIAQSDWQSILQRGSIRMVTLYQPDTFFIWKGQQFGLEYELAQSFARHHRLQLDIILARSTVDLEQRLLNREADFAAALLMPEQLDTRLRASQPVLRTGAQLIGSVPHSTALTPRDLHLRRVQLIDDSIHEAALIDWQKTGVGLTIDTVSSQASASDLIDSVLDGSVDYAIVDDYQFRLQRQWREGLVGLMTMARQQDRVWAVRQDETSLLEQIDQFWNRAGERTDIRYIRKKYLQPSETSTAFTDAYQAVVRDGAFSPYDDWVQKYARYYNFDWRLILAVISQESRFDPNAVSVSGARGLMQVTDVAAEEIGIHDLFEPKSAIHAGVKYLDWVRTQFEVSLDIRERIWLSLAAYNGGIGHITAARELAVEMGLDPNRWFGHVEKATVALSRQPGRRLDAGQITDYVRRVRNYYESYVRLTEVDSQAIVLADRSGPLDDRGNTHSTRRTD